MNVKKVCLLGILVSLSIIFSYIETLISFVPDIPGFKIGLANICVVFALYKLSSRDAFLILILRIILVAGIFGSLNSMIYSLAGAVLAFTAMFLIKKSGDFSIYAVSTAGGVMHNIGQVITACIMLNTRAILFYLPWLIIFGSVSGFLMGVASKEIIKKSNFMEKLL